MTQQEFLEKFDPNYNEIEKEIGDIRLILVTKYSTYTEIVECNKQIQSLLDKAFERALQNFTNKICEKQRMECSYSADIDRVDLSGRSRGCGEIDMRSILEAEQPKIEDL